MNALQLHWIRPFAETAAVARRFLLMLLMGVLTTSCGGHLNVNAPPAVDLAGHWTLNPRLSMDPETVVHAQRPARERRRARPGPNEVGGPLDDSPSRPPEAGVQGGSAYRDLWQKAERERISMLSPGDSLAISQTPSELNIVSGDSSVRYVYGDKVIVSVPNGVADRIAGWDGRKFVVRTSSPEGMRSLRSFELVAGQLIVITQLAGDGPSTQVRLVYDKASA